MSIHFLLVSGTTHPHIDVPAPADCGPLRGTPGYHLPLLQNSSTDLDPKVVGILSEKTRFYWKPTTSTTSTAFFVTSFLYKFYQRFLCLFVRLRFPEFGLVIWLRLSVLGSFCKGISLSVISDDRVMILSIMFIIHFLFSSIYHIFFASKTRSQFSSICCSMSQNAKAIACRSICSLSENIITLALQISPWVIRWEAEEVRYDSWKSKRWVVYYLWKRCVWRRAIASSTAVHAAEDGGRGRIGETSRGD